MLSELLVHMERTEEVASRIEQEYSEYKAIAEAVLRATEMVTIACEVEGYGASESAH